LVLELPWQFGTRIFQGKRGKKKTKKIVRVNSTICYLPEYAWPIPAPRATSGYAFFFFFFTRGVQDGLCPDYIPREEKAENGKIEYRKPHDAGARPQLIYL
jgi:hypothetical protein